MGSDTMGLIKHKKEKSEKQGGDFISFVLLKECSWDKARFLSDLKVEWNIDADKEGGAADKYENILVFEKDGMMATVSLLPAPVPGGEAERNAAMNYLWPKAVDVTKTHTAHLVIAVLAYGKDMREAGKLLVKLCDTSLNDERAIGVYTAGTVFEPSFYRDAAAIIRKGLLPIFNWVYIGLRRTDNGRMDGYTFGLEAFGKDEIEIVNTQASPDELHFFLVEIANYVLDGDVVLNDGETIGSSADEKLPISRSKGVHLDGETLKIEFKTDL